MCVVFICGNLLVPAHGLCDDFRRPKIVLRLSHLHMLFYSIYDATLNAQHSGKLHFYFSHCRRPNTKPTLSISLFFAFTAPSLCFTSVYMTHVTHTPCVYCVSIFAVWKKFQAAISFPHKTYWICWLNERNKEEKEKQSLSTQIANALTRSTASAVAAVAAADDNNDDGCEIPENLYHLFIKHILFEAVPFAFHHRWHGCR